MTVAAASEISLRPARPGDVPRLAEVVDAAYSHYIERLGFLPRPMTQDYAEVIERFSISVAECGEEIVGLVVYGESDEGFVIENVAVEPAHRGTGVGRSLLEHAEAAAREVGFDSIYLYTHERMTENIALYTRIGYVEYERRPIRDFHVVFMRKPLG